MNDFVNDWVRCNLCFKQFDNKGGMLTSCGHFICNRAGCGIPEDHMEHIVCPVCKEVCGAVSLSDTLPQEILQFFENPEKMLQKTINILHFHNHQKELIRRHFEDQSKKIKELETTIFDLQTKNKELIETLEKKQPKVKKIDKKIHQETCMIPGIIEPIKKKNKKEELFPMSVLQENQSSLPPPSEVIVQKRENVLFTPTLASRLQNLTGKKLYSPVSK